MCIYRSMKREQLLAYSLKYKGDHRKIKAALLRNEHYDICSYKEAYLTLVDANYPQSLKQLHDPPYVLYLRGRIDLLNLPMISIIGSRNHGSYSASWTQKCVEHFSDYVIVSGMAKGIDGLAHTYALKQGTIAVLGCGIDLIYPKQNTELYHLIAKMGCIISEYPEGTPIQKHQFVARNRIIAGLGSALLVMESHLKSGSMITVNDALDCGKDVYCLPFSLDMPEGQGNNLLIQQGANILTNPLELTKL